MGGTPLGLGPHQGQPGKTETPFETWGQGGGKTLGGETPLSPGHTFGERGGGKTPGVEPLKKTLSSL